MKQAPHQKIVRALSALEAGLASAKAPHAIIGGIAVIARGVPRDTHDIDAAVSAASATPEDLLSRLARHGIRPRIDDALAFARESHVLLLEHRPTGVPLDVSLAWLPFEEEAIARAEVVAIGSARVPLATVEDLVIFKAVAWRLGDRDDIERLLLMHRKRVNLARVRRWVREFAEALDDPDRVREFEALLKRALSAARPRRT